MRRRWYLPGIVLFLLFSGQLLAQSLSYTDQAKKSLGMDITLGTPDSNNPYTKQILDGRPLIQGEPFAFDRDQNNGPGYFNLNPTDIQNWSKSGSGWTSSGGGGTFLCYQNRENYKKAVHEIQTFGVLSDDSIDAASQAFTHEYLELLLEGVSMDLETAKMVRDPQIAKQPFSLDQKLQILSQMDYQQIIELVDSYIYPAAPVFWDRLYILRKEMPFDQWIPAKLTPVKDFKIQVPATAANQLATQSCLHWPAVVRKFDFKPDVENAITVYFEPRIWEKLSSLNKAVLVFHEEIYAFMNYMGFYKADNTRKLVKDFFSGTYWKTLWEKFPHQNTYSRRFQFQLGPYFGDYYKFFATQLNPVAALGPRATPASWYTSYFLINDNFNDYLLTCLPDNPIRSDFDQCEQTAYHQILTDVSDQRDGEVAFIMLVRFELDFIPGLITGSEWFLMANHGDETWVTPMHTQELKKACDYITSPSMDHSRYAKPYPKMIENARHYCQKYNK